MTAYDEVRYPSYTHAQTHPDRLATAAVLHGFTPRAVDRCRVLELGCGDGSNLVPMASALPGSEFVGVDLAARRIAEGCQCIDELGLKNIRLLAADLADPGQVWGRFDYVIAHGLYSWVPAHVRDRLLAVCRASLADEGVAFVSYNAYPGAHLSMMLREMLLFHVRDFHEPGVRVNQALGLMQFLSTASNAKDGYHQWMRAEAERILGHERGHLYHDELAGINEPVFFKDFAAHAAKHGLKFLAEADFFESYDFGFTPAAREVLRQLSGSRILREQYLDFLKCRRFRQTLLCRYELDVPSEPVAERVAGLFASAVEQSPWSGVDLRPGVTVTLTTSKEAKISTDFAPGKAALAVLADRWPEAIAIPELTRLVGRRLHDAGYHEAADVSCESLCGFLLEIHKAGFVALRTLPPRCTVTVPERPAATALARWQAGRGDMVTSAFHSPVRIEDRLGLHLLGMLDGTRDHGALADAMFTFLRTEGALADVPGGEPELRRAVADELSRNLEKLARIGLLME